MYDRRHLGQILLILYQLFSFLFFSSHHLHPLYSSCNHNRQERWEAIQHQLRHQIRSLLTKKCHFCFLSAYLQEWDVQKGWWGWRMTSLGFRVLYLDSDAIVLRDPFVAFSHPFEYDVQGLTDWSHYHIMVEDPEIRLGFSLLQYPCDMYKLRADPYTPTKSSWVETWHAEAPSFPVTQNPCQSTGKLILHIHGSNLMH